MADTTRTRPSRRSRDPDIDVVHINTPLQLHADHVFAALEAAAFPDAVQAANITCAGILSHASAMAGGDRMDLPEWTLSNRAPLVIDMDDDVQPAWTGETSFV